MSPPKHLPHGGETQRSQSTQSRELKTQITPDPQRNPRAPRKARQHKLARKDSIDTWPRYKVLKMLQSFLHHIDCIRLPSDSLPGLLRCWGPQCVGLRCRGFSSLGSHHSLRQRQWQRQWHYLHLADPTKPRVGHDLSHADNWEWRGLELRVTSWHSQILFGLSLLLYDSMLEFNLIYRRHHYHYHQFVVCEANRFREACANWVMINSQGLMVFLIWTRPATPCWTPR